MTEIEWLQEWYLRHCNGDWEHGYSIGLTTLDNPGWKVSINLLETELEHVQFVEIRRETTETDWIQCWVAEGRFEARGGPRNLVEALRVFRAWAEPAAGAA